MTVAKYLNLTLQLGMSRRDAMLTEISVVNEICKIRDEQAKGANTRGR